MDDPEHLSTSGATYLVSSSLSIVVVFANVLLSIVGNNSVAHGLVESLAKLADLLGLIFKLHASLVAIFESLGYFDAGYRQSVPVKLIEHVCYEQQKQGVQRVRLSFGKHLKIAG